MCQVSMEAIVLQLKKKTKKKTVTGLQRVK